MTGHRKRGTSSKDIYQQNDPFNRKEINLIGYNSDNTVGLRGLNDTNSKLSNDNLSTDKSGFGTQTGKGVGFASRQASKVDELRATGGS